MKKTVLAAALAMSVCPAMADTVVPVAQDYMSSGFFFSAPYVRGGEADSARAINRVSTPTPFGIDGETTYFSFDFNPAAFSGPVASAVFRVEVVAGGQNLDPAPEYPFDLSLHRITADPRTSIDDSIASGPGSYRDFRDSQITAGSVVSTTTVDGLGVFEWDVTSLVNEWIANGDSNFSYTIGTSGLLDSSGETFMAGFVNSSYSALDPGATTAQIVVVPAPGAAAVLLAPAGLIAMRRRR